MGGALHQSKEWIVIKIVLTMHTLDIEEVCWCQQVSCYIDDLDIGEKIESSKRSH